MNICYSTYEAPKLAISDDAKIRFSLIKTNKKNKMKGLFLAGVQEEDISEVITLSIKSTKLFLLFYHQSSSKENLKNYYLPSVSIKFNLPDNNLILTFIKLQDWFHVIAYPLKEQKFKSLFDVQEEFKSIQHWRWEPGAFAIMLTLVLDSSLH